MPEILHRCSGCGFSIREPDMMFCPECGKAVAQPNVEQNANGEETTGPKEAIESAIPPRIVTWREDDQIQPASEPEKQAPVTAERQGTRERTREKLQRASQMTRGAIEGNVKRVEKIHQVSSVVLEEATYDPSLRFVLVALGLFVLFIVLLVLSKVMG